MKIIHTADWHLGNTIYEYDRTYEHKCFLDHLKNQIVVEKVGALLVCGDVFHNYLPKNISENLFGEFISEIRSVAEKLQIFIIAGNHDGAMKLDTAGKYCSLDPNIHIIGTIPYLEGEEKIDYSKIVYPLKDEDNQICAFVIAMPFIRSSYLHGTDIFKDGYIAHSTPECIAAVYDQAFTYTKGINTKGLPVIAMGHATVIGARKSDEVGSIEIGGEESIPSTVFEQASYTALGHIHKHQVIGKNIHYCGSPLPINVGEADYVNGYELLDLKDGEITSKLISVPRAVDMIRIPKGKGSITLPEALKQIATLGFEPQEIIKRPFISFMINPETSNLTHNDRLNIKDKIEEAVDKNIFRLGGIKIDINAVNTPNEESKGSESLSELPIEEIFKRCYFKNNPDKTAVDTKIMDLFKEILTECQKEQEQQELQLVESEKNKSNKKKDEK